MLYFKKRKLRTRAKNLLQAAKNIYNYNGDLMDPLVANRFLDTISKLNRVIRKGTISELEEIICAAESFIEENYPPSKNAAFREIVETLVVAFGVAMAFRAYFFQPFKIPTGSMQPTLYGIHSIAEPDPVNGPGILDTMPLKPLKWLITGTWYKDVVAEKDGTVSISQDARYPGRIVITVAGRKHKVPQDAMERHEIAVRNAQRPAMADRPDASARVLATSYVKKGDRLWAGYVTAGDQVFVNRITWNFFPPKRDDVIVFATSGQELFFSRKAAESAAEKGSVITRIPNLPLYLVETSIQPGLPPAQHYIKRLVGMPGESISIKHPHIYADGTKVENLFGMDRVASMGQSKSRSGVYYGYHNTMDEDTPHRSPSLMSDENDSIEMGEGEYLPMGDNTLSSYDGRYWGTVPKAQMVGPGSCIWWPISVRWGRIR